MSVKDKVVGRLLNKPKCLWASQKAVDDYNKGFNEDVVSKCDNYSFWHDTYCKKHHDEGWGNCTCCNWRIG